MVSRLADRVTIELDSFGDVARLGPTMILSEMTINWGRTSLFAAPMNRTCDVRVFHAAHVPLLNYLQAALRVRVGGIVYFQGTISDARLIRQEKRGGKTMNLISLSAVESKSFVPELMEYHSVRYVRDVEHLWSTYQKMNTLGVEISPFESGYSFAYENAGNNGWSPWMRFWEAFSIAAAPFPGAFANWEPDFLSVHPTTWKRRYSNSSFVYSDHVHVREPIHASLEDCPPLVELTTGGGYGPEEDGDSTVVSSTPGRSILGGYSKWNFQYLKTYTRKVNHPWAARNIRNHSGPYEELLRAQKTSPLEFTIDDSIAHPDWMFYPSEPLFRSISPVGRISPRLQQIDNDFFVPIGGRLRVTPERTTHTMTVIYG